MKIWTLLKRYPKSWIGFVLGVCIPPIAALILFAVLPIVRESRQFTTVKGFEAPPRFNVQTAGDERKTVDSLIGKNQRLTVEEMRLKSLNQMALGDSFALVLDFRDSLAVLINHGVPVRESKILSFQISSAFAILRRKQVLDDWIAKPFLSRSEWSTIPKEPMQIRYAPKDTIEAGIYAQEPVNLDTADVYCRFQFDRDLILNISQKERPKLEGWAKRFAHDMKIRWEQIGWKSGFTKQRSIPSNPFQIDIKLSQMDVKAVYRALPRRKAVLFIRRLPEKST